MSDLLIPPEIWDHQIPTFSQTPTTWLWHGFLAHGNITLLTSQWKSGKTTLLSLLLSRRKSGGVLAGLPVLPGKSVVVSEESNSLWAERSRLYDFGGQVCFFPQPFLTIPRPGESWLLRFRPTGRAVAFSGRQSPLPP
jgi:AAA domain